MRSIINNFCMYFKDLPEDNSGRIASISSNTRNYLLGFSLPVIESGFDHSHVCGLQPSTNVSIINRLKSVAFDESKCFSGNNNQLTEILSKYLTFSRNNEYSILKKSYVPKYLRKASIKHLSKHQLLSGTLRILSRQISAKVIIFISYANVKLNNKSLLCSSPDLLEVKFYRNFITDECGFVYILSAILLPILIGFAGIAVEVPYLLVEQRQLQTIADSAAHAAAMFVSTNSANSNYKTYDKINTGAIAEANAVAEVISKDLKTTATTSTTVTYDQLLHDYTVNVSVEKSLNVYFIGTFRRLYLSSNQAMKAIARSRAVAGASYGNHFCYLALANKADDSDSGAFTNSGSAILGKPGSSCGVAINSDSSSALSTTGSSVEINVPVSNAGGYAFTGNPPAFNLSYASNVADPYDLGGQKSNLTTSYPVATAVDLKKYSTQNPIPNPLPPGHYKGTSSINSGLGGQTGINLVSNGVYFFDDFNVSVPLTGRSVSLIVSPTASAGSVRVTGKLDITANSSGPYAGIAIGSASPNLVGSSTNWATFTGTGSTTFQGAIYFPNSDLSFIGDANTQSNYCAQIIGQKISLQGNVELIDSSPSCTTFDSAGTTIRRYLVRLIQ